MPETHDRARQLLETGQLDAAARLLEAHAKTAPRDAALLITLAEVYRRQGEHDRALQALKKAVNVGANDYAAQLQAGELYARMRLPEEAIRRFERLMRLRPNERLPHLHLGLVYLDLLKQPARAVDAFRLAVDDPACSREASFNLAKALFDVGQVDEAIAQFRQTYQQLGDDGDQELKNRCLEAIAIAIPGAPSADNAAILAARRAWAETIEPAVSSVVRFAQRDRSPDRPLNIGYVSSFFAGENWMKPVWGLINQHDRDQFRVRLISFGPVPACEEGHKTKSAYRPHDTDRVFDVDHVDNERVAKLIEDEQIDVLVDLNGYSDPKRLGVPFLRPAPVVIGWFNMYATTGMRAFHYLIGDDHTVHAEEEKYYQERILRVPGSYLTFAVDYPVPDVAPAPCLVNGYVTFGSLCSRYKITPEVIASWSEILRRCRSARLVLRNGGLKETSECDHMLAQFAAHGIDRGRIELLGGATHWEFLETYARMDIALDTFPYNGGTTTTEAMWQGVPVVAYAGSTWASRTSATLLHEGGLGEWVALDPQGYVALAVAAANDPATPARLAALRANIRERLKGSPVCDTSGFARNMERLYRGAWRYWCEH